MTFLEVVRYSPLMCRENFSHWLTNTLLLEIQRESNKENPRDFLIDFNLAFSIAVPDQY